MELINESKIDLYDEITLKLTIKEYLTLYAIVGGSSEDSTLKHVEDVGFIKKDLAENFIVDFTDEPIGVYYDMEEINEKLGIADEDYWGRGY